MPTLIEQYQEMHKSYKAFRGYTTKLVTSAVAEMVEKTGAKTLLDYGGGKGFQYSERKYHERWGGILPTIYDPGVTEFEMKPTSTFDGVICCDVMEHIPEDDVSAVLQDIFRYAEKFVVLSIFIGPSKKFLPDGRNAHVTQMPDSWWHVKIDAENVKGIPYIAQFRDRK